MKIIIDAMGGDNAPVAPVCAGARAAKELNINIVLVGKEEVIKEELKKYDYPKDKLEIVNATEVISNHEEPAKAVRAKKDASVVVAAKLLRDNMGDAMLSMGNTGALLTAGLLIVGRIKGILRPALGTVIPAKKGAVMLLDMGANTNCRPKNLVQFAIMGSIYMKNVLGIKNPSVGLLSNGEEEGKGDELTKATYPMLKTAPINFYGNVEGRDVMNGNVDVITCDGFVGNVVLKTIEGMGSYIGSAIKDIFTANMLTKIGALLTLKGIKALRRKMDYREYGGAPLLGVKKPVIKGHGASDEKAVYSAIIQAKKTVETNICEDIRLSLMSMKNEEERK